MPTRLLYAVLLATWCAVGQAGTWVYTCDESSTRGEASLSLPTREYPTCQPSGSWVEIQTERWWETEVDGESFRDLLLVTLLCFSAAWAVRMVMDVIRGRR